MKKSVGNYLLFSGKEEDSKIVILIFWLVTNLSKILNLFSELSFYFLQGFFNSMKEIFDNFEDFN